MVLSLYDSRTGLVGVLKINQMGLDHAEQLRTLDVHMYSCLYSTVQLTGASLASVEVSLTLVKKFVMKFVKKFVKKFVNDR